ncbi:MAG: DivIVA domain-containing protein [Ruminococcaceae bacterium]|nr:DivIVA domain-containing protein [Oscillospiraceae bacterium]
MLSAQDVKNVSFSNALRGYKIEDVEVFLDKVEADYVHYERLVSDYQAKVQELEAQIENYKNSQSSIQNVLLNAQKLADQIVNEAKEKSEEIITNAEKNITIITNKEKELSDAFELKANERKAALKIELEEMVEKENLKAKSVVAAAEDSVKRQQVLFDKLKLEIAAFKSSITAKYKEHLSILQEIPETVDLSPQEMAQIITAKINELPNPEDFIAVNEQPVEEQVQPNEPVTDISSGFSVEDLVEE